MNENMRKLRDFMLTMNENINALLERNDSGLYASRLETDFALQKLDRRVNNLLDLQMRTAFSDSNTQILTSAPSGLVG
jgi:ribosome assembly protein YihI (activator of Der GTPase)